MMASLIKDPFDSPDWIFETKLDGFRAITVIDATGKALLWSRNRLPLERKFPTVRDAAEELKLRSTILDGEIVALDEEAIPRFQLLQKWQKRPTAPVVYVLFDLLWDNGAKANDRRTRLVMRSLIRAVYRFRDATLVAEKKDDFGNALQNLYREVERAEDLVGNHLHQARGAVGAALHRELP